jgi:hypothetical protein
MLFALKVLAAFGGFGIGAVASGFIARFLIRLLTARAVHWLPLRLVQLLGGTTLGLAVWFFGLGWGGNGFGLGQGNGSGNSVPGTSTFDLRPSADDRSSKFENRTSSSKFDTLPSELRIELLGGPKVKNERFYVVEGDSNALSLAELQQRIRARMEAQSQPPLKSVELVIYDDSVAQDHPAVQDLERWAREQNLSVTLAFPKREP